MANPNDLAQITDLLRGLLALSRASSLPSAPVGNGSQDHLYRQRIYHLVPYGHFEEVLSLCEQLNAIARARGGTGGTLWIPTIGQQNELIVEFEFNSLATFERGRAATNADPEWTSLVRKIGAAVVPGSVRTELVETAPHLAQ